MSGQDDLMGELRAQLNAASEAGVNGLSNQEDVPSGDESGAGSAQEANQQNDPAAEEQKVPFNRFDQVNRQKKEAMADLKKAREQLEDYKKQEAERQREKLVDTVADQKRPAGYEDWTLDRQMAWSADQVARGYAADESKLDKLLAKVERLEVERHLDGYEPDQVEAIISVKNQLGLDDLNEAVLLAATRTPDLFPGFESGRRSPAHFVQPGGNRSRNVADTKEKRLSELAKRVEESGYEDRDDAAAAFIRELL